MRELTLNEIEDVSGGAWFVPALVFSGRTTSLSLGLGGVAWTAGRDSWNRFAEWWGRGTAYRW